MATINRKAIRARIHSRIRQKLGGTAQRPRLAVYFSNTNVYAQIIDDEAGKTIVSASTKEKGYGAGKANSEHAAKVGAAIAERAAAKNITPWSLTALASPSTVRSRLSPTPPVKKAFSSNLRTPALFLIALYGH